jgi:putative aldouronate transport system permease protein
MAILSISFSEEKSLALQGYSLIPSVLSAEAYRYLLGDPTAILRSYGISLAVTVMGGFLSLCVITGIAYPLSRSSFFARKQLSFFIFFTMLFNGGLVPWYIIITRYLHLQNSIWVLVIPYLANAWYILLMRTYLQSIPPALVESATLDGAGEWRILIQIIIPMVTPALATVGLFMVLAYWNDWWLAMLFIEKERLVPLQYRLYRIMANIQFLTTQMVSGAVTVDLTKLPNESARMAMCVIAAGPMLFVFPFFQKYFVRGLTVGAVKG